MAITLLGSLAGAAAGFAYYYYIGCISGTCPIQTNPWLSTLFGGLIGFLIFSEVSRHVGSGKSNAGFTHVNAEAFKEYLQADDVQLLDVRTAAEFNQGHIPGATLADITRGNFEQHLENLDKSKPVLVYCRSGNRSVSAAKILAKQGFTQIINLKRGMMEWDGKTSK
jgi:rhodanese-related sulfurtransferase